MKYKFKTKDKTEALRITKALDMASVFFDITNLRKKYLKYDDTLSESQQEIAEKIFDDIQGLLYKHNIFVDELIE